MKANDAKVVDRESFKELLGDAYLALGNVCERGRERERERERDRERQRDRERHKEREREHILYDT